MCPLFCIPLLFLLFNLPWHWCAFKQSFITVPDRLVTNQMCADIKSPSLLLAPGCQNKMKLVLQSTFCLHAALVCTLWEHAGNSRCWPLEKPAWTLILHGCTAMKFYNAVVLLLSELTFDCLPNSWGSTVRSSLIWDELVSCHSAYTDITKQDIYKTYAMYYKDFMVAMARVFRIHCHL